MFRPAPGFGYLFLFLMMTIGCGDRQVAVEQGSAAADDARASDPIEASDGAVRSAPEGTRPTSGGWQKLNMVAIRDDRGRTLATAPYPDGWELKSMVRRGEPSLTGPNGVAVVDHPPTNYVYVSDPQTAQLYAQTGQPVRRWPGAEQLVRQDFVPAVAAQGWQLKTMYEVPEVARIDKWYNDQLYKAVPMQTEVLAIATEWENGDGSPALMITHVTVSNTATMQTWSHYSSILKADRDGFEAAKKQYVFSLANTRYALEPIMEYNRTEAEKAGRSWAAHNARMARNQAAFEAQQRDFVNRSNAINESIMAGWRSSNAAGDSGQRRAIDGIREEENSYSASGEQHKTSIHYNNYWLSSDGRYLSTNRNDYDPNRDQNINNQNWEKLRRGK